MSAPGESPEVGTGARTDALDRAVRTKRVLVCVGAGGVGKTTLAAVLALRASASGKSTLVCTIDPAKRLATALGLKALGNAESLVGREALEKAGVPVGGPMRAMMLDMKQSWDALIERFAPPEARAKILANRYYQTLSTALAGSQEYIALEKLWELSTQRDYGTIVLDTPPTAHALDFLDAPNRILDFLDHDATRWLLTPALAAGKVGLSLFHLGSGLAARTLAKFTGVRMLGDLADLLLALRGMYGTFRERARSVRALLASDETAFVLVTSADPDRFEETRNFHRVLLDNQLDVAAVVVNGVHPRPSPAAREELARAPAALRGRLEETLTEAERLADRDVRLLSALRDGCAPTPLLPVPRLESDVHDLPELWRLGEHLGARVG